MTDWQVNDGYCFRTCKEIIQANDIHAFGKQPLAKVRSDETAAARNQNCPLIHLTRSALNLNDLNDPVSEKYDFLGNAGIGPVSPSIDGFHRRSHGGRRSERKEHFIARHPLFPQCRV